MVGNSVCHIFSFLKKIVKPTKGYVRASDSALMTEHWLQEHIDLVRAQLEKVDQALK